MTDTEKMFEKMLNMKMSKEEMFEQCRNVAHKPMTNEEWFCQLSTVEKAKWLSSNSIFMYECGMENVTPKIMHEEDWKYWLKEIYQ